MALEYYKTQVLLLHSQQSTLDTLSTGFNDRYSIHCATSGSEALSTLGVTPIHVIVCAQDLPGMSGLELQEALARQNVPLPIIVVTGHADVPLAVRAMRSRALDVLEKPFSKQTLLDRIQEAICLDAERRRQLATATAVADRVATLTTREREVMELIVQGLANKQMAYQLNLSEKTIETHRSRVMKKMGADSVAELVRMALSRGQEDGGSAAEPRLGR